MNVQDLKQFIDFLILEERELKIQEYLGQSRDMLSNIVSNPGNTDFQNQFSLSFENLRRAVEKFVSKITPAEYEKLSDIGGRKFFDVELVKGIEKRISENSLTPAVVRDYIVKLFDSREKFLNNITQLQSSMKYIGISASAIDEGEAQIGITLPRQLFHNRLDGFNAQLKRFDLVFRFISEAATGQAEHATVGDISASDPSIFFGLTPETIAQLGNAFKWAIDTLEGIAKLKDSIDSLRAQGLKKTQLKGVEDAVEERIAAAVEAKISEMMALQNHPQDRVSELEKGLKWSLDTVMAAVERGVTVELRFLPPTAPEGDEAGAGIFKELEKTSQELAFPAPSAAPILELPAPEPPASTAT